VRGRIPIPLALLLWLGLAPWAQAPLQAAEPAFALHPCRLEQAQQLLQIPAQCGTLAVPEDPGRPAGRKIQLFVARVPALSRQHRPDPLFVLAGGPGLGASDFYPNVSAVFGRIHRDRDIILVDQRGTGRSNPLNCQIDEEALWDASAEQISRATQDCQGKLAAHNDLAQFTTSVAVTDLDAVRQALGYARINLYGSSYGTRVAQHYLRRYPQHARAVILDGVVPPQLALGPDTARDAQNALLRILARCREQADCARAFGDPQKDYELLRSRLSQAGVRVNLADPRSGKPLSVDFAMPAFATVLRLASYSAEQAALLPISLHLASHDAYFQPLAAQFLTATASYDELLAFGMHNSVVCAEDVPYFDGHVDREALDRTFLGTVQVDALTAICKLWPRGVMDKDLHEPLHSDVPALLLSGTADPVTPAAYGDLAAKGFSHALHIKLADQGHGQLGAPCMDRVMAQFLELASEPQKLSTLDHSCLRDVRPAPFFLTLAGPAP
jgi:pimeloyl-ACP methyl ester carboxylesterase